jgi:LAGLIDADG DNA endonuclease family protein
VSGADNQQERLSYTESAKWFLAGFIEGEGSLCVSIKKHPTCRYGFIAGREFFLYQHESGRQVLELAQTIFRTGGIYPKAGSPQVLVYRVSCRRKLEDDVVPFFERYVMPFSCKRAMFEEFREIVGMMARKEHFTPDGLVRIVEKAYAMNPNGKGRERFRPLSEVRERILRGHTSDIQLVLG